jgi:ATP-dependent DNA helicase RecG
MSRKKFKSSRSHQPTSERSFYERMFIEEHPTLEQMDLRNTIRGGEDTYIELKVRVTNSEKLAAEIVALANTDGGAIIFGVNDNRRIEGLDDPEEDEAQLREICRTQIVPPVYPYIDKRAFDNGRRIIVLQVDNRRGPHYTQDYRYYLREGATIREARGPEIALLYSRLRPQGYEAVPLIGATLADIDESAFWSYVRELQGEFFHHQNYPTGNVLREMRLAVEQSNELVPTVAGMLLFGRVAALREKFPRSRLRLTRFSGQTLPAPVVEQIEDSGNLAWLFERAVKFIERYADLWDGAANAKPPRREKAPINARANYHRSVIVEVLSNALIHRDYAVREQPLIVNIFDDRLEVVNPCESNNILTVKAILAYGVAQVLNPRLKAIFTSSAYGLPGVKGGFLQLRRTTYRYTQREPRLVITTTEFQVTIYAG